MRMTTKTETREKVKAICDRTGRSPGDVLHAAVNLLEWMHTRTGGLTAQDIETYHGSPYDDD